jgi:NAD(P)-dependent dehydrogenase (short-subunit alcohol dehydrogenase family)
MTSSQQSLGGRTALVTGATSGIGRAAAIQLAREGADVIVHGRDADRGEQVVAEITQEEGGTARFIAADLSDPTEIRRLADEAGQVDVLVNNAGFSWFGPTADLDVATFNALFDSNVRAPYFLVAALAPRMAANGSGSIVNVASMVATIGIAGAAAYGGTKATLTAMTRAWAAEFSPRGVRVNAVAPGPVYTAADPARIEALGATTLLGRAAHADEIAQVITFLASPASAYLTGTTVAADGGRTAI